MTNAERGRIRQSIENWKEVNRVQERLRVRDLRSGGLAAMLLSLTDVTEASVRAHPPKPTSGIIEMQRLFTKLRKNEASS